MTDTPIPSQKAPPRRNRRAYQTAYRLANRRRINERKREWWGRRGSALRSAHYAKPEVRAHRAVRLLAWKFRLTLEQAAAILRIDRCQVCGAKVGRRWDARRLETDHDHAHNRIRGVLCGRCNRIIGEAGDDPSLLRQIAAYLERPPLSIPMRS